MKILRWLDDNLEKALLFLFLIVMTITMGMQIIARYVFNSPLSWSEELSRFMFVWSGFLSISYCLKQNIAIRIEQIRDFFPQKGKTIFDLLVWLILLAYFTFMLFAAYDFFYQAVKTGQKAPAMQIPMSLLYAAPLIGFALAIFRLIQNLWRDIKRLLRKK